MKDLQDIYNEWQNNLAFREEFRKNPEQAIKNAGFEISIEDLEKIKSILKLKDEAHKSEDLNKRENR